MMQRTFVLDEHTNYSEVLSRISDDSDYKAAQSRLLVVFDPSCDAVSCTAKMKEMVDALPGTHLCGMSTLGSDNEEIDMPKRTIASLLLFDRSDARPFVYDCHDMTPAEAGERLVSELGAIEDVRGILFMSSCITLWPEPFINRVTKAYPTIPVFGAQAGSLRIEDDQSMIMVDGEFYDYGIMAVVFSGSDLHVKADRNMAFRPIGREFSITECGGPGVVKAIDELPAMSLYERYLNLEPDDYFYENVCVFPLIENKDGVLMPRVPLEPTPEGGLRFSMSLSKGALVSLSYSKPRYLLRETLDSANKMAQFTPDGIMMFVCMNRRVFMGNERADKEISYYREVCENACWAYGYGEVLKTGAEGGLLNSTLVAIGFREGGVKPEARHAITDSSLEPSRSSMIPLEDRLVTFLESTTSELRSMIEGLANMAQRDTLTGLYNRRYMDKLLNYEISRLEEDDKLVLAMFDIDHFKQINDRYGHGVGDDVLKGLSRCIENNIRANDVLCRWGGEEFLLLFTRARPELSFILADRIRSHVERHDFGIGQKVTISVGVTVGTHEDTVQTLLKRADDALYDAKNSGRNRVCQL